MNENILKHHGSFDEEFQNVRNRFGQNVLFPEQMQSIHDEMQINSALPGLKLHEPTALILDVNNLFSRAKAHDLRIDWLKLKNIFSQRCDLRYAAAFSAVDRNDQNADGWAEWMQNTAKYTFFEKEVLRYTGPTGRTITKGNMDVDITIAAMELSSNFTHVILGTCDGDFTVLVKKLKERDPARKVSVLGISGDNWSGMSRILAREAHHFYNMAKIFDFVSLKGN